MPNHTITDEGKLLVDEETGRVLTSGPVAFVSRRYCETHSFIRILQGRDADTVFAGPDARRRAAARRNGEGEAGLDALAFRVAAEVNGTFRLEEVR